MPVAALHDLEERLILFFTGYWRNAGYQLRQQNERSNAGDEAMLASLDSVAAIGCRVREGWKQATRARLPTFFTSTG